MSDSMKSTIRKISEELDQYFKNTPREQVLKDWERAGEACKGIEEPTVGEYLSLVTKKEIVVSVKSKSGRAFIKKEMSKKRAIKAYFDGVITLEELNNLGVKFKRTLSE